MNDRPSYVMLTQPQRRNIWGGAASQRQFAQRVNDPANPRSQRGNRAGGRIGVQQAAHQGLGRGAGTARFAVAAIAIGTLVALQSTTPVIAEAFLLPLDDRPWLNNEQSPAPTAPQARKDRPKQSIIRRYGRAPLCPPLKRKLMTEHSDLKL